MSAPQQRLTTTWTSLGIGPLWLQVFSGTAVLQAADRRPSSEDSSGTYIKAAVGAPASALAAGSEWWAKAVLTDTVVSVTAAATSTNAQAPTAGVTAASDDLKAIAANNLAKFIVVSLALDGTIGAASASDPTQFGRVLAFTLAAVSPGAAASLTRHDTLTDSTWDLVPGPVFVGDHGAITQTEPTTGFIQVAGMAISASTVVVGFEPPMLL